MKIKMKTKMKIILGFLLLSASVSFATDLSDDSFIVTRDGRDYLCQPRDGGIPGDPEGILRCVTLASQQGFFSRDEAMRLCEKAWSEAPASCGNLAYRKLFQKEDIILLCRQAYSDSPAVCADQALRGGFTNAESIKLCQKNGTASHAACAVQALRQGYSKDEALRMCKATPN